jgi:hypothetical protein
LCYSKVTFSKKLEHGKKNDNCSKLGFDLSKKIIFFPKKLQILPIQNSSHFSKGLMVTPTYFYSMTIQKGNSVV